MFLGRNSFLTKSAAGGPQLWAWGRNQNGVLATYLRTAKLNNQDAVAKKYLST